MKKIKYLLIVLIAIIIPFSVLAEKTNIKDTVITDIKIPENWKLITKDNLDEMIKWLGYDTKKATEYKYTWLQSSYYAAIVSETKDKEIIVSKEIKDFNFDDLSIYPDEKIVESFSKVKKDYKGYKPTVTLHTTKDGIKYYKVEYEDKENSLYDVEYLTSIHGNIYKFKYEKNETISKDDISTIETIINSVEYDEYLKFIENNKINLEEKKESNSSSIIVIFLFIIIVVVAIVLYRKLTKKKPDTQPTVTQVYNPIEKDKPTNPATADFMETETSEKKKEKKD